MIRITATDGLYTIRLEGEPALLLLALDPLGNAGHLLWRAVRKAQVMGVDRVPLDVLGFASRLGLEDALALSELMTRTAIDATANQIAEAQLAAGAYTLAGLEHPRGSWEIAARELPLGADEPLRIGH